MDWIGTALIVFGLLWAAGLGWAHARAAGKAKASESWPGTLGRIVSSDVVVEEDRDADGDRSTWYVPRVVYAYTAGGRQLEGGRIRFGQLRFASRAGAEKVLAPYPVGASPPVRFNPDDVGESVLETKKPGPTYLVMAVFGLLFVAFGLFWNSLA